MRRFLFVAKSLILVCLVLAVFSAREARAEPSKQGSLALALAQILNLDATSQEAAVAALHAIGVEPLGGWKPAELLTEEVVFQVEEALRLAVIAGRVPRDLGLGALARALNAIGAFEFVAALDRAMPHLPAGGEVQGDLTRDYQNDVSPTSPRSAR